MIKYIIAFFSIWLSTKISTIPYALSPSLFFAVGFSRFLFWLNSSSPAHLFNQGLFKKSLLKNVKNNEIIKLLFGSLEF